jgi:hypothetical protein
MTLEQIHEDIRRQAREYQEMLGRVQQDAREFLELLDRGKALVQDEADNAIAQLARCRIRPE